MADKRACSWERGRAGTTCLNLVPRATVAISQKASRQVFHPWQRVKAKWNSDFRFGGRVPQLQIKLITQLQKAFCFLLFWILSRLFPWFFLTVQAHEEEYQTSGFVGEENLWVLRVTQWNLPAISRRFTQNSTLKCERGSEVFLFLVSLKCSRFYPHAHCSPTCGAYILSQRSFFNKMW